MALPGINEHRKQALARDLAARVSGLAGNWMLAGTAAMSAVRQRLPHGASNRFMSDPGAFKKDDDALGLGSFTGEIKRACAALAANRAIDAVMDRWDVGNIGGQASTNPLRIEMVEGMGYLALTHGGGNCQYQAGATFLALRAAGVRPLDVIYIFSRNSIFGDDKPRHASVVIGIQGGFRNQNEPEVAGWQPRAVAADTWELDRSEPASALADRYSPAEHRFISFARCP
ncbi:hypothetical protein [Muricoccus radiodurans]|uniref:hypothetical protein n=1 Tax=Muricoccus radiodurans TaxID=2231721 RepID=UPI003CEEDA91